MHGMAWHLDLDERAVSLLYCCTCLPPPVFSHDSFASDLGWGAWMTKLTGIT